MIVRQFLRWIQTAPPGDRAEATSALARAYLYSDLSDEEFRKHPLILLLMSHGSRPSEDSLR